VTANDLDLDWRGDPAEIVEADPESVRVELRRRFARSVPDWHALAECRGTDTMVFFPRRGQSHEPALEFCGRCEVRAECLDEALGDSDLDVGVRGGLSARARRRLRAERRGAA
jgi:WhiB family redox-sensing transcriptional regulator